MTENFIPAGHRRRLENFNQRIDYSLLESGLGSLSSRDLEYISKLGGQISRREIQDALEINGGVSSLSNVERDENWQENAQSILETGSHIEAEGEKIQNELEAEGETFEKRVETEFFTENPDSVDTLLIELEGEVRDLLREER
jgi:hypothetical protein